MATTRISALYCPSIYQVTDAIYALLGHKPYNVRIIHRSSRNISLAFMDNQRVWLAKVYGTLELGMNSRAQKEAFFYKRVYPLLYPELRPVVLFFGSSKALNNRHILIREFFNASPITVVDQSVFTKLVEILKRFHKSPTIQTVIKDKSEFQLNEFGEISGEAGGIANAANLEQYCGSALNYWLKNIRTCGYSKNDIAIAEGIKDIMNSSLADMPERPALTHGDIKIGNLARMKQSRELLLFDFENVYSFLPEYDFITLMFSGELDTISRAIPCLLGHQETIDILLEGYYENTILRSQLEKRIDFLACYACLRRWNFAIRAQLPSLANHVISFAAKFIEKNLQ